jgi:peptidoglycan/LPS O-acetylase OafA/YrhL
VVREDKGLAAVLQLRPLAFIGTLSYGIYLLNSLSVHAVRFPLTRLGLDYPPANFCVRADAGDRTRILELSLLRIAISGVESQIFASASSLHGKCPGRNRGPRRTRLDAILGGSSLRSVARFWIFRGYFRRVPC